jgi:hypothetical protein
MCMAVCFNLLIEPQKNCPAGTVAIAHDDDLQLVENVVCPSPRQIVGPYAGCQL